jgi:spore germination protein
MSERLVLILACVLGMSLLAGCGPGPAAAPQSKSPAGPKGPQVMGFWARGTNESLTGLRQYPHAVTVFSPFFYSINPNGTIVNRVDTPVLQQARSLHMQIVPLFNTPGAQSFLGSIFTRIGLARRIAGLVQSQHYQGVDLDFEPAETQYRAGLAAFVIDLRDFMPKGSQLYVDLIPATGPAYDFTHMTPSVTAYVLMSYDQHDDGSAAGPVAATTWVQAAVRRLLGMAPANKIMMGLAFYGYDWLGGTTHAVTLGLNYLPPPALHNAHFVSASQEMHATYVDAKGLSHNVWWETAQGLAAKLSLARQLHLYGTAVWRLGYQTPGLLKMLQGYTTRAVKAGGKRP